jgi:hypothetical protein
MKIRHRIAAAAAALVAAVAISSSTSNQVAHAASFHPQPTYGWSWGE